MDAVINQVKKVFSEQLGNWCYSYVVGYIDRVVEDNNSHAQTDGSLWHYFR